MLSSAEGVALIDREGGIFCSRPSSWVLYVLDRIVCPIKALIGCFDRHDTSHYLGTYLSMSDDERHHFYAKPASRWARGWNWSAYIVVVNR